MKMKSGKQYPWVGSRLASLFLSSQHRSAQTQAGLGPAAASRAAAVSFGEGC